MSQGTLFAGEPSAPPRRQARRVMHVPPTPENPLGLPEVVLVVSLWWRWAAAVRAGVKTIETRGWPWPYEPGWLVLHASLRADGEVGGRIPWDELPEIPPVQPGALCALVWVAGSRPLVPEDRPRALAYGEGRFGWPLERGHRLKPVPMRGPQKFASVRRSLVLQNLDGPIVPATEV